jgi:uncharacterized metal-binding protein YceD (DUF177 family)
VNVLAPYGIAFEGLKDGETAFSYEIGPDFFEMFAGSLVSKADVFVHLTFDKKPSLFVLNFFIDGSITTECDRCLELFEMPVQGRYRLVVKTKDELTESDDPDVLFIRPSDHEINVAQYIYEYINLSVPMQKTCDLSADGKKCDPAVLARLGITHEDSGSDPRWDHLKDLNIQTN